VLAQLEEKYPDDVRIVYRYFPLIGTPEQPFHDKAALSTQAAEAAGLQGKFWEMHDLLMAKQPEWSLLSVQDYESWLIEQASQIGLDVDKFEKDLNSDALVALAQQAWEDGQALGLPGTPAIIFNGRRLDVYDLWSMSAVVELTLLEKRMYTTCPPMEIDSTHQYIATIKTEKGDVVVELFADKAPITVNSFIFLARNGWFNGVTFHRVLPGFIAQAGDPSGTGFGGPGYAFVNETSPDLLFDKAGLLAMANAGPDSNGSQFFITYAPISDLNGSYTSFGEVVSGMDVMEKITARDPSQSTDLPPGDKIITITIEER
jgi:cyclophilin family peptidyl-prolyl cis-trans isomerase